MVCHQEACVSCPRMGGWPISYFGSTPRNPQPTKAVSLAKNSTEGSCPNLITKMTQELRNTRQKRDRNKLHSCHSQSTWLSMHRKRGTSHARQRRPPHSAATL